MNSKPNDMETGQDDQLNPEQSAQNNETQNNGTPGNGGENEQDNEKDMTDENLSIEDPENDLDEEEGRLFPGRETEDINPYDVESEENKAADNEGAAYDEEDMKGTPGYGDNKPESGGYNEDPKQQKVGE